VLDLYAACALKWAVSIVCRQIYRLHSLNYFIAGIAYEFCSLPVFRILGRISFQAFLWHVFILRLVAGYFRDPVYVNSFYLVSCIGNFNF